MENRKIVNICISLFIALTAVTVGTFAYFTTFKDIAKSYDIASEDTVIEIEDFYDLFSFATDTSHNSSSPVSGADDRKTLVLMADLTLEANLFITADCHLDLNGHKLMLDGKTLTFTHGYHGATLISSGEIHPYSEAREDVDGNLIPAKQGSIVFDLPNSHVALDDLAFYDDAGASAASDAFVKVLWQTEGDANEEKYAVYNALYTIADALVDEGDERPRRLTFDEVVSLGEINMSTVLSPRIFCDAGTAGEICVFAFRDLDLPTNYLSSDLKIVYTSTENAMSALGNIISPPATAVTDVIGVTVTYGAFSVSDSVTVHICNPDDSSTNLLVLRNMIYSALSPYYDGEKFVLNRGVHLPMAFSGITCDYSLYSDEEGTVPLKDAQTVVTDGYLVNVEPTVDAKVMRVRLYEGENIVDTMTLPIVSGNTGIIVTNASTAKNIVESWYEDGKIVISPTSIGDDNQITAYSYQDLRLDIDQFTDKYGIVNVEYELMNDTYGVYEIVDASHVDFGDIKRLKVVMGKHPGDYVLDVFANVKFTFVDDNGDVSEEQIQVPVVYDDTLQGDNVNEFLPYYTYYNELLYANYAGATYRDFEVPFCYGNHGPIVCYDVAVFDASGDYTKGNPPFLSISLYYNGQKRVTFDYDGTESVRVKLDAYLAESGMDLQDIIDYGDAKWMFELNSDSMPSSNTELGLIYNYKMTAESTDWTTYPDPENPTMSKIIILGILHLGIDVTDERLYSWIYDSFNISDDSYTEGALVVTDWLKQNVALDIKNDATFPLDADLRFKGLEFLVGTKYLDLSDHPALEYADIADEAAIAISEMVSLETLRLSDCNFGDRNNSAAADNGTVSLFSNLPNLRYLYIDGNSIYSFEWLDPIATLEQVYVYDNITVDFESVFYGSEGLVNLQVFQDLTDRGVMVYNKRLDNNTILFVENNDVNDYVRLCSIEYQRKLKAGADISLLYSGFSNEPEDYHLSTSYTFLAADGQNETVDGVTHSLSFGYSGDPTETDVFTLTDRITSDGTSVNVVIKFRVVRFE